MDNSIEIKIPAVSKNESLARNIIAGFCVELNPTIDEIDDVKTSVSEAVTNCIVHAYEEKGDIVIRANISGNTLHIEVEDFGMGINDIEQAMQPFYTGKPEAERSGMGFTIMKSFMDELIVINKENGGVLLRMSKSFSEQ